MAAKSILSPTLTTILQTHYPLPVQHQPPISSASDISPSPSPLPSAEPDFLGDDQMESEKKSLEILADDKTGQLSQLKPECVYFTPKQLLQ